jgi:hypothetical protein
MYVVKVLAGAVIGATRAGWYTGGVCVGADVQWHSVLV